MTYKLFPIQRQVDLNSLLDDDIDLQAVIRFSAGTDEDLHYEDSPDPTVQSYEILIPLDEPIEILISPVDVTSGTPLLDEFNTVVVDLNQGVIIYPRVCHYVKRFGRIMALKTKGGWKFRRLADTAAGECRYQNSCMARYDCPRPKQQEAQ